MTQELAGLPETIGRYQVRGLLGHGGMGRVVLGHDPVLGRDVALKLVEPGAVDPESLDELRYMFHREARATAALRHAGIVEVYDYSGPDAELLFLACEKLEGPTLRAVLEERGHLSARLVASLGHELAQALDHAHGHDIVHRDIKPENIFWLPSGRVVLSDFGIAKALDAGKLGNTVQFGATNVYGSPAYMAPEQLTGAAAGPATDLHALGAVLYEALTGTQAFDGPDIEAILNVVLNDARPSLAGKTDAPPELTDLVHQLLAKDVAARPPSARSVVASLREALDALDVTDPRTSLRDAGDDTALLDVEEEEQATEMFVREQPERIQARTPAALEMRTRMAAMISRGPVVLGMLGVAVLLGAGAYMFMELSELPARKQLFPGAPVVVTEPDQVATVGAGGEDIFVLLKFPGRAAVWVDGSEVGTWDGQVRFGLTPGKHTLEVRFTEGAVSKEVVLLADTSPVFEFAPSQAQPTDAP